MLLKNKVALVTGAGSGIAKATAFLLAQEGAKVAALGRTVDDIKLTVSEIHNQGCEAMPLIADISQPQEMQQAVEKIIDEWECLDIVFANAGINGVWAPIEDLLPEEWDKTINVNLRGTFLTLKYAVPYLKKQGGSVIITSSVNGTRVFNNIGSTAYSCTKAAQVALAKMIAVELAAYHIRVNVICPGAIATNVHQTTQRRNLENIRENAEFPGIKIPLTGGELGSSEQIAQLVLFLASDTSSHITGTEIWIDAGESLS
ncbi:SDR family oxidoreductase [Calothrix sp. PCC 6303]|uniref:SDR family oxidoreductase n=1 Tax=Calothrix sp. PCC 6303 TaxID=1170562 RepID=UPI0002A03A3E|nr:SDR family NAD(P)-dependent oxidoreductase [Calothrix sp. PCC 6303]AFZ03855.1 3-oxoacyl-(acyl-carrier-protein) reductase [Calothrix sp. PCC 6303]